jgi:glycine cleavage system H protein
MGKNLYFWLAHRKQKLILYIIIINLNSIMNVPVNLMYTKDHEWLRIEDEIAVVGVTDFAQGELGDIVFIEIETVGETLNKEEVFGTIEAVKTVSDMFMPVSGEIVESNPELEESPDIVNKDPYGKGWMVKIKMSNPKEVDDLLSADNYKALL